jgi:GABA(A) receptor-associated protein
MTYKDKPFDLRKEECTRITGKYPDRIPVIIQLDPKSNLPKLDKFKFLVPNSYTMTQCQYLIRKRISLKPEYGLFFSVNGVFPNSSDLISIIYKQYVDADGFLYMTIHEENIFG